MDLNQNRDVFPQLFLKEKVKRLYSSFEYFDNKVINKDLDYDYDTFYSLRLIPEYFKLDCRNSEYTVNKIPQYNWGYSILLDSVNSISEYMQLQFKSKKRNIINRYVNRLEACFDVEYKLYHGNISQEKYNLIMNSLLNMIVERFKERNEAHKNSREWEDLFDSTYNKILNKTASLFVIYSGNEPIEISLNYHYDKILFSYMSSYHIDYSKFGLGHIEIYKQIEWCTKNGYILFEMGVGGMDYKRRWSNNIYRYNHYIIYSKESTLLGNYHTIKSRLKEYLKSKKLNEVYPKFLKFLKIIKKERNVINSQTKINKIMNIDQKLNEKIANKLEINFKDEAYNFIRKNVFNFLYSTVNHLKDVKVYKITDKIYLIKGKTKYHEILLQ